MSNDLIIRAQQISKRFSGVIALDNVDFELRKAEIHALMGENGAGKSTLAKIIAGIYIQDKGDVEYKNQRVNFTLPKQAIDAGISMVMQEFNLLPDLDVAENIFINRQDFYRGNFLQDRNAMDSATNTYLEMFQLSDQISPRDYVRDLSIAEKQIIEIIKAVATEAEVILLDEPTATLSPQEVNRLFDIIRELKKKGVSFVIVSHRIDEIFAIADRVTVLRDGHLILKGENIENLTKQSLVKAMVGREITDLYSVRQGSDTKKEREKILEVSHLNARNNRVKDASFSVYSGEILGISGLMGAGRTELIRAIFGIDKRKSGSVLFEGKEMPIGSIKKSIQSGMAFVPEDRKTQGLILSMSIFENFCIAHGANEKGIFVNHKKDQKMIENIRDKLSIKMHDSRLPVESLSGGNQQKVLLGKWLSLNPKLLFIDEPTRGIDIGAKAEIYSILKGLSDQGMTIVMVSSEIPEILGICDRVLVMKDGRIVKDMMIEEADEEKIGYYASIETEKVMEHDR